jgi:hypothetical protein
LASEVDAVDYDKSRPTLDFIGIGRSRTWQRIQATIAAGNCFGSLLVNFSDNRFLVATSLETERGQPACEKNLNALVSPRKS